MPEKSEAVAGVSEDIGSGTMLIESMLLFFRPAGIGSDATLSVKTDSGTAIVDAERTSAVGTEKLVLFDSARTSSEETDSETVLVDEGRTASLGTEEVVLFSERMSSVGTEKLALFDSARTSSVGTGSETALVDAERTSSAGTEKVALFSESVSSVWAESGKLAVRVDAVFSLNKEPGTLLRLSGVGEAVSSTTSTKGLLADLWTCFRCRRGTASSIDANRMASSIGSCSRET